jgi:4-hydroxy-3-methylbut-2-enyl diphosphate reductase
MQVIKAETAGFCMGVSRAVRLLDKALKTGQLEDGSAAKSGSRLYTLGPIIHNPQLVEEYEKLGVICLNDYNDYKESRPGDTVVIRAHGLPRAMEKALRGQGVNIIDATCPKVKTAQMAVQKAQAGKEGRLLLFGEKEHPEVKGLLSYAAEDALVFGSLEELKNLPLRKNGKYFLAAQTTQDKSIITAAINYVMDFMRAEVKVLQTICDATEERQEEIMRMASQVRSMVVVGGFNSGNTTRLAELSRSAGIFTVHCENICHIPIGELKNFQPVGLSAGASTPENCIRQVEEFLLLS